MSATVISRSDSAGASTGLRRQVLQMIRVFRTPPQTLPWENYRQQLSFCVFIARACEVLKTVYSKNATVPSVWELVERERKEALA